MALTSLEKNNAMKFKIFISLLFVSILNTVHAQEYKSPEIIAYIEKYKDIAISEMKRAKIPASITMAQGILESGFGKSFLALQTNNHFGIKCHQNWTGKTFKYHDDAPDECFRVYDDVKQSYIDHSDFLAGRSRYANLFSLDIHDYKAWAYGLKNAGYATNPKYPELLIKYIETYNLDKLDKGTYVNEDLLTNSNKNDKPIKQVEPYDVKLHKNESTTTSSVNNISKKLSKKVVLYNKLRAVKIFSHDNLADVAKSFNISLKDLLKYNDLEDASVKLNGQYIYLEAKKEKAKQKKHIIRKDDDMWKLSQLYGIRLDALLSLNKMKKGEEPKIGEVINLKKTAKEKPQLRTTINIKLPVETPKKEQVPFKEEIKTNPATTSKDTIYKNTQKYKTSIDENTVLTWEDNKKITENNPIKPFTEISTKVEDNNSISQKNNNQTNLTNDSTVKTTNTTITEIASQQKTTIPYKEVNTNASVHLVEKAILCTISVNVMVLPLQN